MIKKIAAALVVVSLSACSGDGNEPSSANPVVPNQNNNNNNGGNNNGGPITPSGGLPGVWFGNNNVGTATMIIDANNNVYAFSYNGTGLYESVFGPANGQLDQFFHRDSPNPNFAESFTLVGDRPSQRDETVTVDTISYNLQVQNDGQQISNGSSVGAFTMALADANNLPQISAADIAGTWSVKASFCEVNCDLLVSLNVAATGVVTGSIQFGDGTPITLEGNATSAAGASQYLGFTYKWNGSDFSGVLYKDPRDTNRLFMNTTGTLDSGRQALTTSLIRR